MLEKININQLRYDSLVVFTLGLRHKNVYAEYFCFSFRVFQILPDLRMLDGLPKLPSDEQIIDDDESKSGSCTVS